MKKIRIGNDIGIEWRVYRLGAEENLTGRNLKVKLLDPAMKQVAFTYSIQGNVVKGVFEGRNQSRIGLYTIVMVENNGMLHMNTIDSYQFLKLVPYTCLESGNDEEGITTTTVDLETDISCPSNGFDGKTAYELAVENGFEGTITEWLSSINGKSAYQIASENGYDGTEEDFDLMMSDFPNMYELYNELSVNSVRVFNSGSKNIDSVEVSEGSSSHYEGVMSESSEDTQNISININQTIYVFIPGAKNIYLIADGDVVADGFNDILVYQSDDNYNEVSFGYELSGENIVKGEFIICDGNLGKLLASKQNKIDDINDIRQKANNAASKSYVDEIVQYIDYGEIAMDENSITPLPRRSPSQPLFYSINTHEGFSLSLKKNTILFFENRNININTISNVDNSLGSLSNNRFFVYKDCSIDINVVYLASEETPSYIKYSIVGEKLDNVLSLKQDKIEDIGEIRNKISKIDKIEQNVVEIRSGQYDFNITTYKNGIAYGMHTYNWDLGAESIYLEPGESIVVIVPEADVITLFREGEEFYRQNGNVLIYNAEESISRISAGYEAPYNQNSYKYYIVPQRLVAVLDTKADDVDIENVKSLIRDVKSDVDKKANSTELGSLSNLTTTDKTSVVNSINELVSYNNLKSEKENEYNLMMAQAVLLSGGITFTEFEDYEYEDDVYKVVKLYMNEGEKIKISVEGSSKAFCFREDGTKSSNYKSITATAFKSGYYYLGGNVYTTEIVLEKIDSEDVKNLSEKIDSIESEKEYENIGWSEDDNFVYLYGNCEYKDYSNFKITFTGTNTFFSLSYTDKIILQGPSHVVLVEDYSGNGICKKIVFRKISSEYPVGGFKYKENILEKKIPLTNMVDILSDKISALESIVNS